MGAILDLPCPFIILSFHNLSGENILGTLWTQFLLQFSFDCFETLQMFSAWNENVHVVLVQYFDHFFLLFIPCHTKSGGVLCYTLRKFWVSIRPSVSASFPDSDLSSFWPIFFRLCMDIDIREWFGIANWLNLFVNNRNITLDWCKNVVSVLKLE